MSLRAALASERVRPVSGDIAAAIHTVDDAPPYAPALLGRAEHVCVFYDSSATAGGCRIQSALGQKSQPSGFVGPMLTGYHKPCAVDGFQGPGV